MKRPKNPMSPSVEFLSTFTGDGSARNIVLSAQAANDLSITRAPDRHGSTP